MENKSGRIIGNDSGRVIGGDELGKIITIGKDNGEW
jgi:hypothetical protein